MWGKNKYSPFVMLNGVKHLFITKADGKRVLRENADTSPPLRITTKNPGTKPGSLNFDVYF